MAEQRTPASHYEMIDRMTVPTVQSLVRQLAHVLPQFIDIYALPTRKHELIQLLIRALAADADLATAFAALSANERSTISEIIYEGTLQLNAQQYTAIYQMAPARALASSSGKPKLFDIFVSPYHSIPPDLAQRLKPIVPALKEPGAVYLPDDLPTNDEVWIHATAQAACHDVQAVLNLVDQRLLKVSVTTGLLTEGSAAPLRAALFAGDYYAPEQEPQDSYDVQIGKRGIKPFAWALLVQAAGLATVTDGKLTLTKSGSKARTSPPHEVLRTIWQRWIKYQDFHEFSRLEEIKGQKSTKRPLTKPKDARQAINDTLAELDENHWITIDEFFNYLFSIGQEFSVVRDHWALYRSDANYGSLGYDHITWKHTDGRFAMAVLLEYCATLGMIDVGISLPWGARNDMRSLWGWDDLSCMSRYDGLRALRLTPLGAWILGMTDTYTPQQRANDPVGNVLPNFDVVLCRPAAPGVRIQLERIAKQTSDNVYQLSAEKILQACEDGIAIKDLRDFLTEQIDPTLPGTVDVLFQEIAEKQKRLTLESTGYLLRCTDPGLMVQLCHDAATKQWCTAVDAQHLYLRSGNEKAIRAALKKLGYVPPKLPGNE